MKTAVTLSILFALSACGSDESFVDNIGKGNLSLTLQPSASVKDGVSGFKVEVFSGSTLVDSKYVVLETASLPSGFVPDAGNAHNFANTLFVLVPGNYHVKITPMRSQTELSTLCATAEADVVITSNATTTTTLISQCVDANNGGLGVIGVLNNNPQILDLEFNPSQFVSTCQNLTVTMTAQDPDGDALTYNWQVLGAPSGTANTNSIDFERDGSQYLSISNTDCVGLKTFSAFTFEMWVRFESLDAYTRGLISKYYSWYGAEGRAYQFLLTNATTMYVELFNDTVGDAATQTYSFVVDTWYHLATTWNGSTKEFKFYVNGLQVGPTQIGTNVSVITEKPQPFEIGTDDLHHYSYRFFDGLMDEVRVWNIVRTQAEINANKSVMIDTAPGLVGSWHLSSSLVDSSGNGNTLTNNGGATFVTDVPFAGGGSHTSSNVNNVFSFTGYTSGTYNMQGTACDPFNLCSSITAPIYVSGNPCQP